MALTAYRRISIVPNPYEPSGNNGLSFSLNDATNKWAAAFIVSEAITLAKVALYIHSETGTSPAYDWRIETDSGAGRPSGSLAWVNATASVTVSAAGWTALQSLTASSAITPGTIYHLVVQPTGSAPDGSNFVAIRENGMMGTPGMTSGSGYGGYLPCYASRYNGSWATGSGAPCIVLSNSDSSVMFGQVIDATNIYTLTNTAWKGVKIVAPASGTVWGASVAKLNSTSAGAVACKLINSSNTILTTGTNPAGWWDVLTARNHDQFVFDAPQSITAGETYRLVWKDPGAAQRFDAVQCTSATYKTIRPGYDSYMLTEGTSSDGSASPTVWTDSDDEEVEFQLHYSSVSAGGGGGTAVIGNGGLVF